MKFTRRLHPPVLIVARLIVGTTFLVAAIPKLQSPGFFADAVRAFHLLPPDLVLPFAYLLPWLELLIAAYLVAGFMGRIAAGGAIILLGTFIFALLQSLIAGDIHHSCGCFGSASNWVITALSGGNTIGWWDVIRDVFLMLLAFAITVFGPGSISVDGLLVAAVRKGSSQSSAVLRSSQVHLRRGVQVLPAQGVPR